MSIHPILAALRRHKSGVVLISMQIALTLAIVCNAIFIIGQRIERVNRPTGIDERNLFLVTQQWVGAPTHCWVTRKRLRSSIPVGRLTRSIR
jgi:putative ABC transport system permease protein